MGIHPNVNAQTCENSFPKHRESGLITQDDEDGSGSMSQRTMLAGK